MHSLAHPDFVFSKLEQTIVHDANRDEIVSRFGTGEEEWEEEEEEEVGRGLKREGASEKMVKGVGVALNERELEFVSSNV